MYICLCNAITDSQIREAAESGVTDLWGLQSELGVASSCGSCKEHAMDVVREAREGGSPASSANPKLYRPAVA